jgi:hypothetical protein
MTSCHDGGDRLSVQRGEVDWQGKRATCPPKYSYDFWPKAYMFCDLPPEFAKVDVQSKRIYQPPFRIGDSGAKAAEMISFRLDSRLLVLNGRREYPDHDTTCGMFYYEWNGRSLKLVRAVHER